MADYAANIQKYQTLYDKYKDNPNYQQTAQNYLTKLNDAKGAYLALPTTTPTAITTTTVSKPETISNTTPGIYQNASNPGNFTYAQGSAAGLLTYQDTKKAVENPAAPAYIPPVATIPVTSQPSPAIPAANTNNTQGSDFTSAIKVWVDYLKEMQKQRETNPYQSPYNTDIANTLASIKNYQMQQYDPNADAGLNTAQKFAQLQTIKSLANKGTRVFDPYTAAKMQEVSQQLIPQYQQSFENRQQQDYNNMINRLSALSGLENQAFNQHQSGFNNNMAMNQFDLSKALGMTSTAANVQNQGVNQNNTATQISNTAAQIFGVDPSTGQQSLAGKEFDQKTQMQTYGLLLSPKAQQLETTYKNVSPDKIRQYNEYVAKFNNDYAAAINSLPANDPARNELESMRLYNKLLPNITNPTYQNILKTEYGISDKQITDLINAQKQTQANTTILDAKATAAKLDSELQTFMQDINKELAKVRIDNEKTVLNTAKIKLEGLREELRIAKNYGETEAKLKLDQIKSNMQNARDQIAISAGNLELGKKRFDWEKNSDNPDNKFKVSQIDNLKNDTVIKGLEARWVTEKMDMNDPLNKQKVIDYNGLKQDLETMQRNGVSEDKLKLYANYFGIPFTK